MMSRLSKSISMIPTHGRCSFGLLSISTSEKLQKKIILSLLLRQWSKWVGERCLKIWIIKKYKSFISPVLRCLKIWIKKNTKASFHPFWCSIIKCKTFTPLQLREMEYIERASFVEIYGLKLAYPISFLSLCFDFFKAHNILRHFRYQWFWSLFRFR